MLLLNTDVFVSPDTLLKTVNFMDSHPCCGVLGVKIVGEDGALQPSCHYFATPWNLFLKATGRGRFFPTTRLVDDMSWDDTAVRECDWVPGCYYLVRREVIEIDRIGLFDPRYFLYYEEVGHCHAVRQAGLNVIYYPFTQVVRMGGVSTGSEGPVTGTGRQILTFQIAVFSQTPWRDWRTVCRHVFNAEWLISACGRLLVRGDLAGSIAAMRPPSMVLKWLAATGLATRATR